MERVVTVSGDAIAEPGNFKVLVWHESAGTGRRCRRIQKRTGEADLRWSDDGILLCLHWMLRSQRLLHPFLHLQEDEVSKYADVSMYQLRAVCGRLSEPSDPVQTCRLCGTSCRRSLREIRMVWNVWNVDPAAMSVRRRRQLKQSIGSMKKDCTWRIRGRRNKRGG